MDQVNLPSRSESLQYTDPAKSTPTKNVLVRCFTWTSQVFTQSVISKGKKKSFSLAYCQGTVTGLILLCASLSQNHLAKFGFVASVIIVSDCHSCAGETFHQLQNLSCAASLNGRPHMSFLDHIALFSLTSCHGWLKLIKN